jgi:hypothetical protein
MTGVEFPAGAVMGSFLFAIASMSALGSTQPIVQWVLGEGGLTPLVKWPGCEDGHFPPSSAEVKNMWGYVSTPPVCLNGVVLN